MRSDPTRSLRATLDIVTKVVDDFGHATFARHANVADAVFALVAVVALFAALSAAREQLVYQRPGGLARTDWAVIVAAIATAVHYFSLASTPLVLISWVDNIACNLMLDRSGADRARGAGGAARSSWPLELWHLAW